METERELSLKTSPCYIAVSVDCFMTVGCEGRTPADTAHSTSGSPRFFSDRFLPGIWRIVVYNSRRWLMYSVLFNCKSEPPTSRSLLVPTVSQSCCSRDSRRVNSNIT